MKQPAVYILASQKNGTLYIGVTEEGNPQWRDLYDEILGSPGSPPPRG
jgi:hypothetical protein